MDELKELIEREKAYCDTLDVGSDEYKASVNRILDMEETLNKRQSTDNDRVAKQESLVEAQKARKWETGLKIGTTVVSGVAMPLLILAIGVKEEREINFTGVVKRFIDDICRRSK